MSHQPFENWILGTEKLTPPQREVLVEHLAVCPACRQLDRGWRGVAREISDAQMMEPRPGFRNRWLAQAAQRQVRDEREQTIRFVLIMGAAMFGLLALFGVYFAVTISAAELADMLMYQMAFMAGSLTTVSESLRIWLQETPVWLSVMLLVTGASSILLLMLSWGMALHQVVMGEVRR